MKITHLTTEEFEELQAKELKFSRRGLYLNIVDRIIDDLEKLGHDQAVHITDWRTKQIQEHTFLG